jgi:Schlafen group 3, DNA/RNA helicase domain
MDRHATWCTIVCLVGGGQEINAGEAGLTEWLAALKKRFEHWKIFVSPQLTHRDYHWGQDMPAMLMGLRHQTLQQLHLAVSVRSFRAEKLSEFVGALIAGEIDSAKSLYASIKDTYPVVLTRELELGYALGLAAPSVSASWRPQAPPALSQRASTFMKRSTQCIGS